VKPTKHRLGIDFRSTVDLMEWFEMAREAGVFGYDVIPADLGGVLVDERPKKAVGVRVQDSVDNSGSVAHYIVSGHGDAGIYLNVVETEPETQVVMSAGWHILKPCNLDGCETPVDGGVRMCPKHQKVVA